MEKEYIEAGYRRYERSYIIKEQHKEYTVTCPEYRDAEKNAEPLLIIPDFLTPRRPYPVYVYLYAIILYIGAPNKGQRWAARETRKRFGLTTFAHTTLGRALKAFVRNTDAVVKTTERTEEEKTNDRKATGFPTAQLTEAARNKAAPFLRDIPTRPGVCEFVSACMKMVREWFMVNRRLLL